MPRSLVLALGLVALLAAGPASAGLWFDIGGGQVISVPANTDFETHEIYAPFAFGANPLGSLVYEDISIVPCEALGEAGQVCGEFRFVRGFRCQFSGVACGCGGALVVPTTIQLSYDPLVVLAAGGIEDNLKLFFRDEDITAWTLMPGAVLDTQHHRFTASWDRNVLGTREFAILTYDITPTTAGTWGRIKVLYRR